MAGPIETTGGPDVRGHGPSDPGGEHPKRLVYVPPDVGEPRLLTCEACASKEKRIVALELAIVRLTKQLEA